MSAISCKARCCLLVIFNFFSLDVETVAIDAAGCLSDIVYVSNVDYSSVTCAKRKVVNEARDERLKPMAFSWLQLQLYIAR